MHITEPRLRLECQSRTALHIACLFAVLAALGGCGGGSGGGSEGGSGETDGIVCTAEARSSVLLTVVNQANVTLTDVSVTYQVNGGTSQNQTCESGAACTIGYEVAGTFSITAAKSGYSPASDTVTVTRNECHAEYRVARL